jgi:hypothetical protein
MGGNLMLFIRVFRRKSSSAIFLSTQFIFAKPPFPHRLLVSVNEQFRLRIS